MSDQPSPGKTLQFLRRHRVSVLSFAPLLLGVVGAMGLSSALPIAPFDAGRTERMRSFGEAWDLVSHEYVIAPDDEEAFSEALRGLAGGLDRFSQYYSLRRGRG
jgi:hypothetical protein